MGVYSKQTFIDELKRRFEGKTIASVEQGKGEGCVGHFTMTDGASFRLHATDLGEWFEEVSGSDGCYPSLAALMTDYDHEEYERDTAYTESLAVAVMDDAHLIIMVEGHDREFRVKLSNLTEQEKELVDSPGGLDKLAGAAGMGDFWMAVAFDKRHEE